jgi:3'-phosphoadenosine 5'-phosphosulfate sulfotransferase (PAPS reductase)/FAD synthetase
MQLNNKPFSSEIQNDIFYSIDSSVDNKVIATDTPSLTYLINRTIDVLMDHMQKGFIPILATSMGKDSILVLTLALEAARRVKMKTGKSPVLHILHGNTLVEDPLFDSEVSSVMLGRLESWVSKMDLDVTTHIASPSIMSRGLVSTLGGRTTFTGVLSSNAKCSIDMKVNPLNSVKSKLVKQFGHDKILTVLGTRYSESVARSDRMMKREERFDVPWKQLVYKTNSKGVKSIKHEELFLSPIADWPTGKVFEFLENALAGELPFKPFDSLFPVYNYYIQTGMDVCPTSAEETFSKGCGSDSARSGCWMCQRSENKSLAGIVKNPDYAHFKPLLDFNNLIRAGIYVPEYRTWFGRRVNEDGTVDVSAVAHSFEWVKTLLTVALTIDAEENEYAQEQLEKRMSEAEAKGIDPNDVILVPDEPRRFRELVTKEELLAIAISWQRYYSQSWAFAVNLYNEVHSGKTRLHVTDAMIEEVKAKSTDDGSAFKTKGRFKLGDDRTIREFINSPYRDLLGEVTGLYETDLQNSGLYYSKSKDSYHGHMAENNSIDFFLGDEPELTWFWISEEAQRGNADYSFLIRSEIFAAPKGYQSTYATGMAFGGLLKQLGLMELKDNVNALTQDPRFIPKNQNSAQLMISL